MEQKELSQQERRALEKVKRAARLCFAELCQ